MILSDEALSVIARHNGSDEVLSDAANVDTDEQEITSEDSDNAITDEQEAGSMDAAESDFEDEPTEEVDSEQPDSEPAEEPEPEETASDDDAWMQDVRYLADSYGLSEEELRNLGSREAFEKAAILFDKRMFAAQQEQPQNQPQGEEKPSDDAPADDLPELLDVDKLKESGWDEDILSVAKLHNQSVEALRKERESRSNLEQQFAGFRQAQEEAAAEHYYRTFDSLVDNIDPDMFGQRFKDGKEQNISREHFERRSRLLDATDQVARMLASEAEAKGQQLPPLDVVIRRARNYAFADDLMSSAKREVQEKATRQSRSRRPKAPKRATTMNGAAASRKNDAPESEYDIVNRIVNSPEWQADKQRIAEKHSN